MCSRWLAGLTNYPTRVGGGEGDNRNQKCFGVDKGEGGPSDLVEASRSVGRWLQVSKQANQLDFRVVTGTMFVSNRSILGGTAT